MLGVFEKVNLNIPARLEERSTSKLESSHLLGEYVVSRYSESSTLYISSIPARTSYPIQISTKKLLSGLCAEIRLITYSSPCVFALIGNDMYGLNVEANEIVRVPPPPHTADISSIRSILVSPSYLAGINLRQIVVWIRANESSRSDLLSSGGSSDPSSPPFPPASNVGGGGGNSAIRTGGGGNNANNDHSDEERMIDDESGGDGKDEVEADEERDIEVAKVINLGDEQERCGCGQIGIVSEFSRFMGDNLVVIVNNTSTSGCAFQIWDVHAGDLVAWAAMPFKGSAESFITFACAPVAKKVVGSFHSQVCIWDITQFKSSDTKELQAPVSIPSDISIVTSLYVDESFIIIGDNYGSVKMFDIHTNAFIGLLCGDNATGSQYDDDDDDDDDDNDSSDDDDEVEKDLLPMSLGSLSVMFKNKVTKIIRVGRWIVVTFASGRVELYDIFATDTHEAADFFLPGNTSSATNISAAEICNGRVVLAYTPQKTTGVGSRVPNTPPEVIVWTPKPVPDTFEYFAEFPVAVRCATPLRMIRCTMEHIIARCDSSKVELTAHATKLREAAAMVDALDRLRPGPPFCFVQDMADALDFYDIYLGEVAIYRSKVAKNAPLLAEAARKFYISLDLLGSLMDYVGEVDMRYTSPDAVRTAPPLGRGSSAVFSFRRRVLHPDSGFSLTLAETDPRVCMMLSGANVTLSELHGAFSKGISIFDETCNAELSDDCPYASKIDALISIYTKLNELNEDCKEAGKDVGELIGEKQKGKWYEGGGKYREPDISVSPDPTGSQH